MLRIELRGLFVQQVLSPRGHLPPLASALEDHHPHARRPLPPRRESRLWILLLVDPGREWNFSYEQKWLESRVNSALFSLPLLCLIDPHFVPARPFSVILTAATHNHTKRLSRKCCFLAIVLNFRILWSTYREPLSSALRLYPQSEVIFNWLVTPTFSEEWVRKMWVETERSRCLPKDARLTIQTDLIEQCWLGICKLGLWVNLMTCNLQSPVIHF